MIQRIVRSSTRHFAIAIIGLPLLLYGLYLGLAAADRFVSESVVSVRQSGGDGGSLPGAALMLAGITPAAHEDTLQLKDFVHSQGLLDRLEATLKLREHFAQAGADWPFQLRQGATREDFVRYYRSRVEVSFDDRSALLKVRTQGFTPEFAQRLNQGILDESERFVNETSHRIARERMRFAEGELSLAGQRLQAARNELLAFQTRHKLLDPTAQAASSGALAAELQATRSRLEAELNSLLTYLREDAYQVRNLQARLNALDQQIAKEREQATSENRKGGQLNVLAADFQALQLKVQFAQDAYRLALAAVENARIESTRKLKNLVVVEPPTRPETAEYPLKAYNLATLLTVCVLFFAIGRLVLAIIREHQD
jgi:capsular polysaccharide transport system permease protein